MGPPPSPLPVKCTRTGEIQVDQESVALIDRAEDPTQCPGAAKLLRCDEGVPSPQPASILGADTVIERCVWLSIGIQVLS